MADYYNTHLRKTTDPTVISKEKLERGMVVKLRYKKDSGAANYIILILQPKWPNSADGKVHALSLNAIAPGKVQEMGEYYKEVLAESTKVRKLELAKVQITSSSKVFYTDEIKNDKKFKAGYRTFDLKKIVSIKAVNYNWGQYDKIPSVAERKELLEQQQRDNEK